MTNTTPHVDASFEVKETEFEVHGMMGDMTPITREKRRMDRQLRKSLELDPRHHHLLTEEEDKNAKSAIMKKEASEEAVRAKLLKKKEQYEATGGDLRPTLTKGDVEEVFHH